jgi:hypothetical protein
MLSSCSRLTAGVAALFMAVAACGHKKAGSTTAADAGPPPLEPCIDGWWKSGFSSGCTPCPAAECQETDCRINTFRHYVASGGLYTEVYVSNSPTSRTMSTMQDVETGTYSVDGDVVTTISGGRSFMTTDSCSGDVMDRDYLSDVRASPGTVASIEVQLAKGLTQWTGAPFNP